jgi:hypothetical protein
MTQDKAIDHRREEVPLEEEIEETEVLLEIIEAAEEEEEKTDLIHQENQKVPTTAEIATEMVEVVEEVPEEKAEEEDLLKIEMKDLSLEVLLEIKDQSLRMLQEEVKEA